MKFAPKVYAADDYHAFEQVRRTLVWAGFPDVQYVECGFGSSGYLAVFFSDAEEAAALITATSKTSGGPDARDGRGTD